jgi:hypothetical protein
MVPLLPSRGFLRAAYIGGCCFLFIQGCALLFPDRTAPKSQSYTISPPGSPWHKLAVGADVNATDAMKADMAFENPDTGAIISLNSICRKYSGLSLESLTENLVRGIPDRKQIARKEVTLDGAKGLDTTFEGTVDDVFLNLRTVTLIKGDCTYDFIHVTVPNRQKGHLEFFDTFLQSFRTT